jgi:hypothetical protein
MNTVWIVLNNQAVTDRLRELIDHGQLGQANEYAYLLEAFITKIKSFVQNKGGSVVIALYERIVIQLSVNDAEEIPDIIKDYQDRFAGNVACGIGVTFAEAAKAAEKSVGTGQIELYDPSQDTPTSVYQKKETPGGMVRDGFDIPGNLFDPLSPVPKQPDPIENPIPPFIGRPTADQEAQGDAQQVQILVQQLGGGQQAAPGQDQEQPQQPQDLLEALNGGPVQGHNSAPKAPPESGESEPKSGKSKESKKDSDEPDAKEVKEEVDEAEKDASKFNDQLADQLHNIKAQLPQIMALADSNPKAFSQAMNMISKLITVAKQRNKVSKSQKEECDELSKALNDRLKAHLPIGTTLNRKKKVMVNGKATWRSMVSGQVKDASDSAISVRSSNLQAEGKGDDKGTE